MWKQNQHLAGEEQPESTEDLIATANFDGPDGVTSLGRTLVLKGELRADEHLIIEGRVEGQISAPEHGVAVGRYGAVGPSVFARTVTILGHATGSVTASEIVELLASAQVEGRIVSPTVAIDEGAKFNGFVDPKLSDVALAVGRHRFKQRTNQPTP